MELGFQSVALSGEGFQLSPPTGIQQVVRAGASLGLPGTPASTTMPVEVSWLASKDAGVTYELQESVNGGAFTTIQTGTGQSITRDLQVKSLASPGKYQYRVRALKDNLTSAWNTGGLFTFAPYDDKDTANLKFGGTWSTENNTANYGGSVKFSTAKGSNAGSPRIQFTTSGTFAVLGDVGPSQGQIEVKIDGKSAGIVDEYAPAAQAKRGVVVYANNGLAVGQHDVSINVPGTKNNLSTGFRVDLDGFVALK